MENLFKMLLCFTPIMLMCGGCGHNVFTELKAIGLDATVPVYGTPVGVRIGQSEITTASIRGNCSFTTQSSTGGGLVATTGGTGRVNTLKSGPQLNEGYVESVMTSDKVPAEVKIALAKNYLVRTAPEPQPTATKTIGAATGSGSQPPEVEPSSTGIDKIVDKTAEVAPKIVPPVAEATKEAVVKTVDTAGTTVTSSMSNIKVIVKYVVLALLALVVLALVVIKVYTKYKAQGGVAGTVVDIVSAVADKVKDKE